MFFLILKGISSKNLNKRVFKMSDRMMATSYRFEQNKGTHVSKRHAQELKISVKDYLEKLMFSMC